MPSMAQRALPSSIVWIDGESVPGLDTKPQMALSPQRQVITTNMATKATGQQANQSIIERMELRERLRAQSVRLAVGHLRALR